MGTKKIPPCPLGFCSVVCFSWQNYREIHTHMRTVSFITTVPQISLYLFFPFIVFPLSWFVGLSRSLPRSSPPIALLPSISLPVKTTQWLLVISSSLLHQTRFSFVQLSSGMVASLWTLTRFESERSGCLVRRREQHTPA